MKTIEEIKTKKAELKKLIQELKQIKPRYIGTHLKLNKALTELSILNWVLDEFEAI